MEEIRKMENKTENEIKKTAEEFFEQMGFEIESSVNYEGENSFSLNLKTEEPQILIGSGGKTLSEIQKVLGRILRKQLGEELFIDLDINQYKKNKKDYLRDLAQSTADEVSLQKEEKALPPMTSYERRIVHLALVEREDVKTESQGEDPDRRIVIKPSG